MHSLVIDLIFALARATSCGLVVPLCAKSAASVSASGKALASSHCSRSFAAWAVATVNFCSTSATSAADGCAGAGAGAAADGGGALGGGAGVSGTAEPAFAPAAGLGLPPLSPPKIVLPCASAQAQTALT